jgi:hypothetical protein
MTLTPLQQLATEYAKLLTTKTRTNNSDAQKTFICLVDDVTDNHPIRGLIRVIHSDMLPDDYIYQYISESLDLLADYTDPNDVKIESDIYNYDLLCWVKSHAERICRCDEVLNNDDMRPLHFMDIIRAAQWEERNEVFHYVRHHLEVILENQNA